VARPQRSGYRRKPRRQRGAEVAHVMSENVNRVALNALLAALDALNELLLAQSSRAGGTHKTPAGILKNG